MTRMTAVKKSPAVLGVLSMIAMAVSMPNPAFADENQPRHIIQAQGQGRVKAAPDSLTVSYTVETHAKTMVDAREQNAKKSTAVARKLKGLGLPGLELETDAFSANPEYRYEKDGRSKVVGYVVSNTMTVRVEKLPTKDAVETAASRIVDGALTAGASTTGNVSFYLNNDNPVFDQALSMAVKQARHKAEVMADAANTRIVGISTMETYSSSTPMQTESYATNSREDAPMADGSSLKLMTQSPIVARSLEVEASVTARFDISN